MVTNIIEQKILRAQLKWQLAIGIVFTIGFLWWLYRQYVMQKLQMAWYATAILESKKELGNDLDIQETIQEALSGDSLVAVANKVPLLSKISGTGK
jgi:type VI protein secretion system component VasK